MKLIVIEGPDGCGKTTQAEILFEKLKKKYEHVFLVSFPNYGSKGCKMVEMYLNGEFGSDPNSINPYVASSFYAIDRYMYFKENKFPKDSIIICNRYTTSNLIHQMSKLPKCEWIGFNKWLSDLEFLKYDIPMPTLEVYLYLKPEVSLDLIKSRYNSDESKMDIHETLEFQQQSVMPIEEYLKNQFVAKMSFLDYFKVVDCNSENSIKPVEEIADLVWDQVEKIL